MVFCAGVVKDAWTFVRYDKKYALGLDDYIMASVCVYGDFLYYAIWIISHLEGWNIFKNF